MDAFIRNLHRDGVPNKEEKEPENTKESDGKLFFRNICIY